MDCGPLGDPDNGVVLLPDGTTEGAEATYVCDAGYDVEGSSVRTCSADGAWSDAAPRCAYNCLLDPCVAGAECEPTPDGFTCTCRDGFESADATMEPCVYTDAEDDLILHLPFDGDAWNYGSLGADFDGSENLVTYVDGVAGQAAEFEAGDSTSRVRVEGTRGPLSRGPEYTIALWLYEETVSSQLENAFSVRSHEGNGCESLYHGVDGSYLTTCCGAGGDEFGVCGGTADGVYAVGEWRHFILRYAGESTDPGGGGPIQLYIDGVLYDTMENPDGWVLFGEDQAETLLIGAATGYTIDDFRVYNRVFDDQTQCEEIVGGTWDGDSCVVETL